MVVYVIGLSMPQWGVAIYNWIFIDILYVFNTPFLGLKERGVKHKRPLGEAIYFIFLTALKDLNSCALVRV